MRKILLVPLAVLALQFPGAPSAEASPTVPCTYGAFYYGVNGFGPSFSGVLYGSDGAPQCGGFISGTITPVDMTAYNASPCNQYDVAHCWAQTFFLASDRNGVGAVVQYTATSSNGASSNGQCYLPSSGSACYFSL